MSGDNAEKDLRVRDEALPLSGPKLLSRYQPAKISYRWLRQSRGIAISHVQEKGGGRNAVPTARMMRKALRGTKLQGVKYGAKSVSGVTAKLSASLAHSCSMWPCRQVASAIRTISLALQTRIVNWKSDPPPKINQSCRHGAAPFASARAILAMSMRVHELSSRRSQGVFSARHYAADSNACSTALHVRMAGPTVSVTCNKNT